MTKKIELPLHNLKAVLSEVGISRQYWYGYPCADNLGKVIEVLINDINRLQLLHSELLKQEAVEKADKVNEHEAKLKGKLKRYQ